MGKYLKPSEELNRNIVNCLHKALCDDIILDYERSGLARSNSNSYSMRKWDYVYGNMMQLNSNTVIVGYTVRNPWHLAVLFDCATNTLYAVMREKRFMELSKSPKRFHHYITCLAKCFNSDVESDQFRLAGFDAETPDEEVIRTIEKICSDINVSSEVVERFALVLFSESNHIITDIKLCAVNGRFEICETIDLRGYIDVGDEVSARIEHVSDNPVDDRSTKVKLTGKSRERLKKRGLSSVELRKEDEERTGSL